MFPLEEKMAIISEDVQRWVLSLLVNISFFGKTNSEKKLFAYNINFQGNKRKLNYRIRELFGKGGSIYLEMQFVFSNSFEFKTSWYFTSRNLWKKRGDFTMSDIQYICITFISQSTQNCQQIVNKYINFLWYPEIIRGEWWSFRKRHAFVYW